MVRFSVLRFEMMMCDGGFSVLRFEMMMCGGAV